MTITINEKITKSDLDTIMQENDTMLYDDLRKGHEYVVTVKGGLLEGQQFSSGLLRSEDYPYEDGDGWTIEDFYEDDFAPYQAALDDLLEQINAAVEQAQLEEE